MLRSCFTYSDSFNFVATAYRMRFFRFYCKRFRFYKCWTSLFPFLYYFRFVNEHRFRFC